MFRAYMIMLIMALANASILKLPQCRIGEGMKACYTNTSTSVSVEWGACAYGLGCKSCRENCDTYGYLYLCCIGPYCCCFQEPDPCNSIASCPGNYCT